MKRATLSRTHVAHAMIATLAVFFLPACVGDETADHAGIYAAACDPLVTIDFKPDGVAEINRNFCEGYGVETWSYAVEDDKLTLAPEGKLGDPGMVHVEFRISGPTELTPTSESGFLTCNNCDGSEVWLKQ